MRLEYQFRTVGGAGFKIECDAEETVRAVQRRAALDKGLNPDNVYLTLSDQELDPSATLATLRVRRNDDVMVLHGERVEGSRKRKLDALKDADAADDDDDDEAVLARAARRRKEEAARAAAEEAPKEQAKEKDVAGEEKPVFLSKKERARLAREKRAAMVAALDQTRDEVAEKRTRAYEEGRRAARELEYKDRDRGKPRLDEPFSAKDEAERARDKFEKQRQEELTKSVRERYLGERQQQKRVHQKREPNKMAAEKFKWADSEDTSQRDSWYYKDMKEMPIMFGEGLRAGIGASEQGVWLGTDEEREAERIAKREERAALRRKLGWE